MKPKDLLAQLTDKFILTLVSSIHRQNQFGLYDHAKPGDAILSLSEEDRKLLSELKSDDIADESHPYQFVRPKEPIKRKRQAAYTFYESIPDRDE